jgi:hypothetical protein
MQPQSFVSGWRQHLTCATCAVALVSSLAIYHKTVLANPVMEQDRIDRKHNSALDAPGVKTQFCHSAIAQRKAIGAKVLYQAYKSDRFGSLPSNNTKFNSLTQTDRF